MSKNLLMITLTVFSVTAISTGGAAATESRLERDPILRDHRPAAPAQDFRVLEEGRPYAFGPQGVESEESHVVKTGVFSSIKNGVKKAAKAVGTAAKRAGTGVARGVKQAAKAVAKSPFGRAVKKMGSDVKKTASTAVKIVKKFLAKKK